jgi:hypothetical protein
VAAAEEIETQLAWEARQRPRAAVAALVAAILIPAGTLWTGAVFADAPFGDFVASVQQALKPGPIGNEPSVGASFFQFWSDHFAEILGASALRAVGLVALGWTLTVLAAAVRARRQDFPRIAVYVSLIGAILAALETILGVIGTSVAVNRFLDGPRTVDAGAEVSGEALPLTAGLIGLAGQLALASGLILVSINAMRTGLVVRFLGILGVIVAALSVLRDVTAPLDTFVMAIWLFVLALLLTGRAPGGLPPAWRTGQAEPWPTAAEVAAARRAAAKAPQATPQEPPAKQPAPARPASSRRKRKRRN